MGLILRIMNHLTSQFQHMSLTSKIYVAFTVMLTTAAAGAILAWQASQRSVTELERVQLANDVYLSYLKLSVDTYQLINRLSNEALLNGDNNLIGDDNEHSVQKRIAGLQQQLLRLRHLIGLEIKLVGEEEIEELETVAAIAQEMDALVRGYVAVVVNKHNGATAEQIIAQLNTLDASTRESAFSQLISEAIDEEASEVAEVRDIANATARFTQQLALVFLLIASLGSLLSLIIIVRNLRQPLQRLRQQATNLAGGASGFNKAISGPREFRELGAAIDHMISELQARQQSMVNLNQQLESTVAERTAKLNDLLDQLKNDSNNRRRLLADVSHELRTPLTVIRGEADIALRGQQKSPEDYEEALNRIRSAAMHTAKIVDDLLFVARQECGEVRLKLEAVDMVHLLPEVINNHRNIAHFSGSLRFNAGVTNARVSADPLRIQQVLLILLENAIRYGGGDICIELISQARGYQVAVVDQGPGMTDSECEQAFERFFRGNNAAEQYQAGGGLGLPVARSIIEAHGGDIGITSNIGVGTTVTFTLNSGTNLRAVS